jgi:hypothetical protein
MQPITFHGVKARYSHLVFEGITAVVQNSASSLVILMQYFNEGGKRWSGSLRGQRIQSEPSRQAR